jgi:uncharacterized ferritin-like protein (DUF455 family)
MDAPATGTLQRWAWDYLAAPALRDKLVLGPPPLARERDAPARRSLRPARSREVPARRAKTPGHDALRSPERRARLLSTFLHHELQAAELMCWAILAFPEAPDAFHKGLATIAKDEVRHMGLYASRIAELGFDFTGFAPRDWFWERVPGARTPAHFVATLGIGLEGGNLDHARRFAMRFRAIGDHAGADLQEQIFEEEIPHVRFAFRWFREWTGRDDFAAWLDHLTPPLSPILMRGHPVEQGGRMRAGFSEAFVDELCRWRDRGSGS